MSKLKVYVGFDHNSKPIGVLLSDSKEKADIAWTAMGDSAFSIEEIDPDTIAAHNGMVFLLTSCKKDVRIGNTMREMRVWKRGAK